MGCKAERLLLLLLASGGRLLPVAVTKQHVPKFVGRVHSATIIRHMWIKNYYIFFAKASRQTVDLQIRGLLQNPDSKAVENIHYTVQRIGRVLVQADGFTHMTGEFVGLLVRFARKFDASLKRAIQLLLDGCVRFKPTLYVTFEAVTLGNAKFAGIVPVANICERGARVRETS